MYALANAILLCRQHCKHIKKELEHTQTRPTPGGEGDKERERESALRTKAGEWREATEKKSWRLTTDSALPDNTSFTTSCFTTACFNISRLARGATWHLASDSALPEFVSHSRDFVRISVKNECKIRNVS